MTNAIQPAKTLQERVGERIREQIGDLLTDDDLKRLVETALHEAFFKQTVAHGDWGRTSITPAPVVEIVRGLLKERVDAAVSAWLSANSAEFAKHLDDAIGQGFSKMLQDWLDMKLNFALGQFGDQIKSSLGVRSY